MTSLGLRYQIGHVLNNFCHSFDYFMSIKLIISSYCFALTLSLPTFWQFCSLSATFISPLPVKPGGTIGFLAVCPSVCPSVSQSVRQSSRCPSTRFSELFSVVLWDIDLKFGLWICLHIIQIKFDFGRVWFTLTWVIALCLNFVIQTFLCHLSTYWVEISYMNLSWHNTGQVRLGSCLTYFYMSYCPLLKFRFPDFSLSSFDILSWNVIYGFVLTYYRSSFNFVVFDLLLIELLPCANIKFSDLFSSCLVILTWHFGIWICLDIIQIKFDFYCVWPDYAPDIFFCLNLVFRTFLCRLARYRHQIWGMNLYWHNTDVSFHIFYLELCLFEICWGR